MSVANLSKSVVICAALIGGAGLLFAVSYLPRTEPAEDIKIAARDRADKSADFILDRAYRDENLQRRADDLLPMFDAMPPVAVYLRDEPVIANGTNTERGVAYTFCEKPETPVVIVKKSFYEKNNRVQLTNILKHELTHAWLCRQQLISVGHGAAFRRKFDSIGGWGNWKPNHSQNREQ